MMRRSSFLAPLSLVLAAVACGSRTGLFVPTPDDAAIDDGALDGATIDSAPPDVTLLDASDASDAPLDLGTDTSDASTEGGADAPPPDAPWIDAGGPDAGSVLAPRPIAPLSTSRVTRHRPTFHWELAWQNDGAFVEICKDRACTTTVTSFAAKGTSGAPATALKPGTYFWRLHGTQSGTIGTATSPTWEVRVPVEDTAVDSSWGTFLDLDGDAYADLAMGSQTLNSMSDEGAAYVLTGGPPGSSPPLLTFVAPYEWYSVYVFSGGDIDGDGYPELVAGSTSASDQVGAILIYRGGPAWASTPPITLVGPAGHLEFVAMQSAGDVNGDGYADLVGSAVTSSPDLASVYLYLGGPTGLSGPSTILPGGGVIAPVVATDLNGDELSDLVVAVNPVKGQSTGAFDVYYGAPGGPSSSPVEFTVPSDPAQIFLQAGLAAAGDVNGDGYGDIAWVVPYMARGVDVHFGGPAGLSSTALSIPDPGGGSFGFRGISLGDVNADGFDDLAITDPQVSGGGKVSIYLGAASPPAQPSFVITQPPTAPSSWMFAVGVAGLGDFNGDGYDDVGISDCDSDGGEALVYFGGGGAAALSGLPEAVPAPEAGAAYFAESLARLMPVRSGGRRRR